MFLKNANAYLSGRLLRIQTRSVTLVNGSSSADLASPTVMADDSIGTLMSTLLNTARYVVGTASVPTGVVFGTGNRTPSIDDYTLSGDLVEDLTTNNVTQVLTTTEDDGRCSRVAEYTISNTTGADITIGEVGLVYYVSHRLSASNTNVRYSAYLFERTALEAPVTIPAGGIGRVTYTITMNDPVV